MQIKKLLIANRGEIVTRIIRTAKDLGIDSVAIYSEEDRDSEYVGFATEGYSLDGSGYETTYKNGDKILEIAKKSGADAIHPGYGALSENAEFAIKCEESGVKWLGPSGEAIDRLGDKIKARKVAEAAKVSPVPGISEALTDETMITSFVQKFGFPVILKRADGGGGQGITICRTDGELNNFLTAHRHDLEFYFIERFVENARHVETQCARDTFGNFVVISTRDCSVQRRNQKLIEEAPAPFLTDDIINILYKSSESLFKTVGYEGVGTCEFLLETKPNGQQEVYFLEVNPRIQVEHTISEEISDLDIVEQQIRIAEGKELTKKGNLPLIQAGINKNGSFRDGKTSFELRITSENPKLGMQPTAGVISELKWPTGPGIRLEPGICLGDTVTTNYDSMVAKIIVTGFNRKHAIARAKRALSELEIQGISTPKEVFERVLNTEAFAAETKEGYTISTKWLENTILPDFASNNEVQSDNSVEINEPEELKEFFVEIDSKRVSLKLPASLLGSFSGGGAKATAPRLSFGSNNNSFLKRGASSPEVMNDDPSKIASPMQGIVVRVAVEEGQKIQKDDLVVILEAMKMEKFLTAPAAGTVKKIHVEDKESVNQGTLLIEIEVDE